MRISEIDAVLTACKESLTSFSVIDSTVVEAADQSEIQHPVVEDSGPLSKKDQDLLEELKRICKVRCLIVPSCNISFIIQDIICVCLNFSLN